MSNETIEERLVPDVIRDRIFDIIDHANFKDGPNSDVATQQILDIGVYSTGDVVFTIKDLIKNGITRQ